MKVLIIAPHPDDEVLGVGGTIAGHAQKKDEVYLVVVTCAYTPDWTEKFIAERSHEVKKANQILGITKTFFLDFPTVKLDTVPQKELNDALAKVIDEVRPEAVYIPHGGDLNKDHRLVFEAALVATRPFKYTVHRVLSYEILSETEWGQPLGIFAPTVYKDITATLSKKLEAMKAYESELRSAPHPRSLEIIEVLARKRGSECGVTAAEGFMLIREIDTSN